MHRLIREIKGTYFFLAFHILINHKITQSINPFSLLHLGEFPALWPSTADAICLVFSPALFCTSVTAQWRKPSNLLPAIV